MYNLKFHHAPSEDVVKVTAVLGETKVQCQTDKGRVYVFDVPEENVKQINERLTEFDARRDCFDDDYAVFAVAPNSVHRDFINVEISQRFWFWVKEPSKEKDDDALILFTCHVQYRRGKRKQRNSGT